MNHYTKRFKVKEEDIDIKKVKCLSFTSIVKKYSIQSIDKLFVDAEGSEFKILSAYRNHNLTSETTKSMKVEDILRKLIKVLRLKNRNLG